MPLDVDRIPLQRARQLDATARDKGMGGLRLQYGVRGNAFGWLENRFVIRGDEARFDRGLCPGPAFEQAAIDQQQIGALAGRAHVAVGAGQGQFDAGARAGAARRPAAMRTHVSKAVRSCQMSAGILPGVTSAQPCRSSA